MEGYKDKEIMYIQSEHKAQSLGSFQYVNFDVRTTVFRVLWMLQEGLLHLS